MFSKLMELLHIVFTSKFDRDQAMEFIISITPFGYTMACLYLLSLFILRRAMSKRRGFNLIWPLRSWNLSLAIFSICGFFGTIYEMKNVISTNGVVASFCHVYDYYDGISGYWVFMFTMSKLWELGDTFFIILRKRELVFLHYFHHFCAVLFTFNAYPQLVGGFRWGIFLNYSIHSLLYTYYFLTTFKSIKRNLPTFVSESITILQNVQFVIANGICLYLANLVYIQGAECDMPTNVYITAQLMFVCFQALFTRLYIQRYGKAQPVFAFLTS